MSVYVDLVFFLNFLTNALLLYGAARLGAAALRLKRLLLAAALGAGYAVLVYLPGLAWLRAFPIKLIFGGVMIITAFGRKLSSIRLGGIFGILALVLCGGVYGTALLQEQQPVLRGGDLFYPVSFATVLLTAAVISVLCRFLLPKLNHGADSILPLTLELGERKVQLSALRDSGNTLQDPLTGAAVITVYWSAARKLFPVSVTAAEFSAPATLMLRLKKYHPRLIPYRAVGVRSSMLLALPCRITLGKNTTTALVAFSPTPLSDGGAYEALTGGTVYA